MLARKLQSTLDTCRSKYKKLLTRVQRQVYSVPDIAIREAGSGPQRRCTIDCGIDRRLHYCAPTGSQASSDTYLLETRR
jgi:hypothetical protein